MYVRSLSINGLADLPSFRADELGRQVSIRGYGPAASAVGDGLALIFAALSERALCHLLLRWGLVQAPAEAEVTVEGLPVQATWSDRRLAKSIVSDHGSRTVRARAEVLLDPPLATRLRSHAAREPRLAVGLDGAPTVNIEVSAFFGASWDVLSISVQSVIIGGERFPIATNERAPWMSWLLKTLGERFVSHDETREFASKALASLISPAADRHAPTRQWQKLAPVHLGHVRVAQLDSGRAIFLSDDRPLSRHGATAVRTLEQSVTATMMGADVMWLGAPEGELERLTEGDESPLEQLWTVSSEGSIDPAKQDTVRSILPFGSAEE